MLKKNLRYESLNFLRAFSCIGIVLMHVLANVNYNLDNKIVVNIIKSFTQLVYLFMMISSFSMCCGYYEKIKNNQISIEEFYSKRIKKLVPFFLILVILELLYHHDFNSLIESFADITLMFGFLPKSLDIIGVGWFLGLVFIFYMIFPFFVFLFSNKKRAWIVTIVSFFMNLVAITYFKVSRINMFYSFVYFCLGGIIYLYKDKIVELVNKKKIIFFFATIFSIILYYIIPESKYIFNLELLIAFGLILCYSISVTNKILNSKIINFISNISLEIYLSHMFIFQIINKLNLTKVSSNNYISYIVTCVLVLFGTVVFSSLVKNVLTKFENKITKEKIKKIFTKINIKKLFKNNNC